MARSPQHQQVTGTIRVAAPSDLVRSVLLPIVDGFFAEHPQALAQLGVTDRINDVPSEQVDVALRYGLVEEPGAVVRQLASVRRVACVLLRLSAASRPAAGATKSDQAATATSAIKERLKLNELPGAALPQVAD